MATRKIPAATIGGDPNTYFTVTTDTGRVFEFREMDALEEFRLNSLLGGADATNPTTSFHALLAVSVRKIDGTRWEFPETRNQLENAIMRLGKDGFRAVSQKVIERTTAADPEKDMEEAGNSPATPV